MFQPVTKHLVPPFQNISRSAPEDVKQKKIQESK